MYTCADKLNFYIVICSFDRTTIFIDNRFMFSCFWREQFCVHTDKRKMLQQLTKDINQQPKKVRVMHELVKSVAAGNKEFCRV